MAVGLGVHWTHGNLLLDNTCLPVFVSYTLHTKGSLHVDSIYVSCRKAHCSAFHEAIHCLMQPVEFHISLLAFTVIVLTFSWQTIINEEGEPTLERVAGGLLQFAHSPLDCSNCLLSWLLEWWKLDIFQWLSQRFASDHQLEVEWTIGFRVVHVSLRKSGRVHT